MTDHEQAVKDVEAVAQNRPGHMTTLDAYRSYAVAQREARLRLEDALKKIEELLEFHEGSEKVEHKGAHPTIRVNAEDWYRELASTRAALDAVKEG